MNIFIMLALLLANVIAITLIYQFIKKLPKKNKIIFITASFAIIYILVSVIYWISGFGIEKNINEAVKDFIIFAFVPVNVIILIPFIAIKYNKLMLKKIQKEHFIKTIVIVSIIALIILTIECLYFKGMKKNIKQVNETVTKQTKQNESKQSEQNTNETISNNTIGNEILTTNIIKNKTNDVILNNQTTNNKLTNEEKANLQENQVHINR